MTREQMEQFVKKFEKPPKAEPGPGRNIEINPQTKDRTFDPNRKVEGLNLNSNFGTKSIRDRGSFAAGPGPRQPAGEPLRRPARDPLAVRGLQEHHLAHERRGALRAGDEEEKSIRKSASSADRFLLFMILLLF